MYIMSNYRPAGNRHVLIYIYPISLSPIFSKVKDSTSMRLFILDASTTINKDRERTDPPATFLFSVFQ